MNQINPTGITERVKIVFADELPKCLGCDEPYCDIHEQHYGDCPCMGPNTAEDHGWILVEREGVLWAER